MVETTCCVIGCREIPDGKREVVEEAVRRELLAVMENGYTRFLLTMESEAEQILAALADEQMQQGKPLYLEAVIPYAGLIKKKGSHFQEALERCNGIKIVCEQYTPDCEFLRIRELVSGSSCVIAVWDGQETGDTLQVLRAAHAQGKDVRCIQIAQ